MPTGMKGGYSREIVQVYKVNGDDFSLSPVTALLYRGRAPSDEVTRAKVGNFWGRVLYDDSHKVAVMASSVGPSGWNGSYVFELNKWLKLMEEKVRHPQSSTFCLYKQGAMELL